MRLIYKIFKKNDFPQKGFMLGKSRPYCFVRNSPYVISYISGMTGRDFKDILELMLHGIDISLVDPDIFPHLDSVLCTYLDNYRLAKDQLVISKLEFYQKYINEYPRKQEISSILTKEPPPAPVVIPALSPEQVNEEVDLILQTGKIKYFKPDELDLILEGLRKKRTEFIDEGNYLDAQKAEHYSKAVMSYGQLGFVENIQDSKASDLQAKLEEAKEQLEQKKINWENLRKQLRKSANEELSQLQKSHQQEIEKLESLYDTTPPPSIRKYSNSLLSMRKREQAMISSRLFAQAGKMKEEADELERIENMQQMEKWKDEIDIRIKNLKIKQEKTLMTRKNYWKKEETTLINQANKEVEKEEKAVQHLEKHLEVAMNAKSMAENLKNDSKNVKDTNESASSLPPLNNFRESRSRAMAHRQRAILNHKIYTKVPKSRSHLG